MLGQRLVVVVVLGRPWLLLGVGLRLSCVLLLMVLLQQVLQLGLIFHGLQRHFLVAGFLDGQ